MSTEQDQYGIWHIDGPSVGGFTIAENPDGSGQSVKILYKALRYYGTKAECEKAYDALMNLITSELQDLAQIQPDQRLGSHPIIWWRHRVSYEPVEGQEGQYQFYCRLDTTPPLPRELWERWMKPEGSMPGRAKEVYG